MTVREMSVLLAERAGVAVIRRIKESTDVNVDGTRTDTNILNFFAENPFATTASTSQRSRTLILQNQGLTRQTTKRRRILQRSCESRTRKRRAHVGVCLEP
jgi:hypothetical protein